MDEPRSPAATPPPNQTDVRRRAQRGIVAGYLHELSARHQAGESRNRAPEAVNDPGGC